LYFPLAAAAQERPVPQSIPPIDPLLRSGEPRLIALGAWEVIKRPDDTQMSLLIDLAEHWDPAQRHRGENGDAYDAMAVVLDALIQRKAQPSPAAVLAVSHAFPDQALILASRLQPDEEEPILRRWYQEGRAVNRLHLREDSQNRLLLARVAAMFLARDHPDEVAASLLSDTRVELAVSVTDPGSPGIERCFFDCEFRPPCPREIEDEQQIGWPPVFDYALEEDDPYPERRDGMLIYAGGDTITWRRVLIEIHQDDCFLPRPLTPITRHALLTDMLHVRVNALGWGPQMNLSLVWAGDQRFTKDVSARVAAEEEKLQSTVLAFFKKGLLTQSQRESIRPRLSVMLFDDRQRQSDMPDPTPLPVPSAKDERTVLRLAKWP